MDAEEFERLSKGDFRTGDFIRDRNMAVAGWVVGKGTIGNRGWLFYRVDTPSGDMFIPVCDAVAPEIDR